MTIAQEGLSSSCLIIGEIAQAHDGSLGTAHAYIDAIANAGADAVKFQTHIASAESTPSEPWRVKFGYQDKTRYDYWRRMEFTEDQWRGLKKHADESGLLFLSSPFSLEAVELLSRVGIGAWKIASGEVTNTPFIEQIISTGKPILLSSGMSYVEELDAVVEMVKKNGNDLTVLQCTSSYPTPPEQIGLNMLSFFRERYNCKVGLSDHSGTVYAGIAAVVLGANVVEVHITFNREMFGPDVKASITTSELRLLVDGIRYIEQILSSPINKDLLAEEMQPLRDLFTKSVVARMDIPAGTVLQTEHLTLKKPGAGIQANQLNDIIGRRLRVGVEKDQMLKFNDLEV